MVKTTNNWSRTCEVWYRSIIITLPEILHYVTNSEHGIDANYMLYAKRLSVYNLYLSSTFFTKMKLNNNNNTNRHTFMDSSAIIN